MTGPGWNNPNLFEQIQAAGLTIVASDVLIVPGNAINTPGSPPAFTTTSFSVDPSETIWMDTQAVGNWGIASSNMGGEGTYSSYSANGSGYGGISGLGALWVDYRESIPVYNAVFNELHGAVPPASTQPPTANSLMGLIGYMGGAPPHCLIIQDTPRSQETPAI